MPRAVGLWRDELAHHLAVYLPVVLDLGELGKFYAFVWGRARRLRCRGRVLRDPASRSRPCSASDRAAVSVGAGRGARRAVGGGWRGGRGAARWAWGGARARARLQRRGSTTCDPDDPVGGARWGARVGTTQIITLATHPGGVHGSVDAAQMRSPIERRGHAQERMLDSCRPARGYGAGGPA